MGYNATGRTPASGSEQALGSVLMSCSYNMTGGTFIYRHTIRYRKNGGPWQESSTSGGTWTGTCTFSKSVSIYSRNYVEWYATTYWVDEGGTYQVTPMAAWSFHAAPDTTDPTITDVTPATGNAAPGGSGVVFAATVEDNVAIASVSLEIDGTEAESWTEDGYLTYAAELSLGAHTYEWIAEDTSGNTATTGAVNITVINGVPEVPSGTITVAGETGAVEVANLGNVLVSWPAFPDGNPEDSLTYTLEDRAAGGGWSSVATGLTGLSTYWTPDLGLGAVELRVKATDSTGDSSYLTRTGITVLSSQSPTEPVLTAPAGGESWREGETHDISWAESTHPEGLPIVYQIEFSALGDFSDAVPLVYDAEGASWEWTLDTGVV